jgi:hypothetical protein
MPQRPQALTLAEAAASAPALARLIALAQESSQRLRMVLPLLAPPMRMAVKAGPIDEAGWCLLAANNAVAAKLRQLVPAMLAHLRSHGIAVTAIRIKVASTRH